jgi:hypothetical protein
MKIGSQFAALADTGRSPDPAKPVGSNLQGEAAPMG